jgi:hypothetical protein
VTFAQPWLLIGALAGLIPLAVHLFDRRKPRPHPFAAIAFVLRSQRRTASRLKLKRILLYTLRTLILLAIPLALARPELRRPGAAVSRAVGPAATVVVVDRGLAMRWTDGQSLFEKARSEARSAVATLGPEDPVTVLPCGPQVTPPTAPGLDRSEAREVLDKMRPAWSTADLSRCFEVAARALEESPTAGKRIVVVSAFTAGSLRLETPLPTLRGPNDKRIRPEMVLRDVARGYKVLPNHFLAEVKAEPAPQSGARAVQVSFTVRNVSDAPAKEIQATVELSGRVVGKTFLELTPGGTAQKTLTVRSEVGGAVVGAVTLSPDGLAEDDRRDFVVQVPRELRALVVNGAPNPVRYRDEVFFLEAALTAPSSPVRPVVKDASAGLRESLEGVDVVVLANVPAPGPEEVARLKAFVERGGGLLISMGDKVEPEPWTARMGELLPRPLRLVKAAGSESGAGDGRQAKLGEVHWSDPLFAPFSGRGREGLMGARFQRYMLVEGGAKSDGSEVLAAYDDGAPAVLTARRGRGRVLLFTSTLDRDWGDFAIRTSYLPLMQRAAAWLAGALDERETLEGRVGQTLTMHPDPQAPVASVKSPSGAQVPLRNEPDRGLEVGPLPEPGLYRTFDAAGQLLPASQFPVTLDPADSDLTRLDEAQLQAYFGEEAVRGPGGTADRRVPVWTWLVVTAALAFFAEGLLLRKP